VRESARTLPAARPSPLVAPVAVIALCLAFLTALAGAARAATPIPPCPADRVAAAGLPDTLDPLRAFLAGAAPRSGAQYAVLLVALTSETDAAGPDTPSGRRYTDRVAEQWAALDGARHVLVVVSRDNRNLTVHTGSRWARLGLEGAAVTDLLATFEHATYFRAGDYAGGIRHVIERLEAELLRRIAAAEALSRPAAATATTRRASADDGSAAVQRTLTVLTAIALLLGVATVLGARAGARRKAREALAAFEKSLGAVATKVLSLEEKHPFVKDRKGFGESLKGRSRAAFEQTATLLDGLFTAYHGAKMRLGEAQDALAADGLLRWRGAKETLALLGERPIPVGGAQGEPPLPAKSIAGYMEQSHHLARERCEALEASLLEVKDAIQAARAQVLALDAAFAPVAERGASTKGFTEARKALEARADALDREAQSDPIEAMDGAKALQGEAEALAKRAADTAGTLGTLAHALSQLEALLARIRALRAETTMTFREEGVDPEGSERRAHEIAERARAAAGAADEGKTADEAALAARVVFELERQIQYTILGHASGVHAAAALEAGAEQRRKSLEKGLRLLRAAHAEAALAPIAAGVLEVDEAIEAALRERAAGVQALAERRWFAAANALEDGRYSLKEADERKGRIEALAKGLAEKRRAAERALGAASQDVDAALRVAGLKDASDLGISYAPGDAAARALRSAREALAPEAALQKAPRPHWPERAVAAEAIAAEAAQARALVEKEQKVHQAVGRGAEALAGLISGTAARIAAHMAAIDAAHDARETQGPRAQSHAAQAALSEAEQLSGAALSHRAARRYDTAEAALREAVSRHESALAIEATLALSKAALDARRADALSHVARAEARVQEAHALLASSARDREEANRVARDAAALLEDVRRMAQGRGPWQEVNDLADRVHRRAGEAMDRAREDFRLEDAAREALDAARRAIGAAERDHGWGERGGVGVAQRLAEEAQEHLARREYERALDRAQESQREAGRADADAQARADQRAREDAARRAAHDPSAPPAAIAAPVPAAAPPTVSAGKETTSGGVGW